MRYAIAAFSLSLLVGCRQEPAPSLPPDAPEAEVSVASLLGRWQLDADTREWVPRACVVLNVDDLDNAAIEVAEDGGEVVVRLLGAPSIPFVGRYQERTFDGRQILPTTATGRFCGPETVVRLLLRLERGDPDALRGTWQTPECDVCPDRHFGAVRVGTHRTM